MSRDLAMARCRVAVVAAALAAAAGCSSILPRAGDGGPLPLTDERAAAIARRNVCGEPGGAADRSCVVRGVERTAHTWRVTIDRGPAASGGASGDRVRVTVRDNGMRVRVEPVAADASGQ
jgi:hypothetical protein